MGQLKRKQNMQFSAMKTGGLWERRAQDLAREWSVCVNDDLLLDGFRHRPGMQAFIGEHVGKFLHGAIYLNELVQDDALAEKITFLLEELISCQEEYGYLGTYLPDTRWWKMDPSVDSGWDLWVSKYCLLALYAAYQKTQSQKIVDCAEKLIVLLNSVYGKQGFCDLNCSDEHRGLASGSVLEPLMLWYEVTGIPEALALAEYIVEYYWRSSAPHTPHLLENMNKIPNGLISVGKGKAYEMMSCFVGLIEYARLTGKKEYLDKVILVRDQIALYYRQVTGCMSEREWFGKAMNMTEKAEMENCVAFTWIQLNTRLFELTGDIRCMEFVEETAVNHLLQALSPDGSTWIYYSTLTGPKDLTYYHQLPTSAVYREAMKLTTGEDVVIDENQKEYHSAPVTCCTTNGQRAFGITPQYACTLSEEGDIYVNLYFAFQKTLKYEDKRMQIVLLTDFPRSGDGELMIHSQRNCKAYLRVPQWASCAKINGVPAAAGSWFEIPVREGDNRIAICFEMKLRLLTPGFCNRGKFALAYGPMVLAADSMPAGWTFDEIVLELPENLDEILIQRENGWPCISVPAKKCLPVLEKLMRKRFLHLRMRRSF